MCEATLKVLSKSCFASRILLEEMHVAGGRFLFLFKVNAVQLILDGIWRQSYYSYFRAAVFAAISHCYSLVLRDEKITIFEWLYEKLIRIILLICTLFLLWLKAMSASSPSRWERLLQFMFFSDSLEDYGL
ncbi:hypothetical protein Pint_26892 [Pistacia integerrima]|uniref:Uncharacterized protein n=1 Tax=Pistacia integerrima TaxID=434235 RepID=A0ACC0YPG4_9ROSI|nr:hypothetical protein Pint_26892 [Pistacia integerrima]